MPDAILAKITGHRTLEMVEAYSHLGSIDILTEELKKYPFLNRIA
jgi:hypothetical protein